MLVRVKMEVAFSGNARNVRIHTHRHVFRRGKEKATNTVAINTHITYMCTIGNVICELQSNYSALLMIPVFVFQFEGRATLLTDWNMCTLVVIANGGAIDYT